MADQTSQVMGQIFEDHETLVPFHHDFEKTDDIAVAEVLEQLDLPDCGERKTILLAFHFDLFQSDLVLGEHMYTLEYFAVGTRANHRAIARLAVVNRVGLGKLFGQGWSWFEADSSGLGLGRWLSGRLR